MATENTADSTKAMNASVYIAIYNMMIKDKGVLIQDVIPKRVLFVCVEVLRPSQQPWSCRASQLPINTVSEHASSGN